MPTYYFYTPWKRQKTEGFDVFRGYRNGMLVWKGLTHFLLMLHFYTPEIYKKKPQGFLIISWGIKYNFGNKWVKWSTRLSLILSNRLGNYLSRNWRLANSNFLDFLANKEYIHFMHNGSHIRQIHSLLGRKYKKLLFTKHYKRTWLTE